MEKIWGKRSSRNEVINILMLIIFLYFFMIYQEFLQLKICKKGGLYALDPCGADVALRGHVRAPWEQSPTPASLRGCLRGAMD